MAMSAGACVWIDTTMLPVRCAGDIRPGELMLVQSADRKLLMALTPWRIDLMEVRPPAPAWATRGHR